MYRVLAVGPTAFFSDRGCHIRIYEEARSLESLGVRVRVLSYSAGEHPGGIDLARSGRWVRLKKLDAGPSVKKPLADLSLLYALRREIKEFKPDILHCHLHEGAFIGLLGAIGAGIPVVLDYQGSLSGELSEHNRLFGFSPIFAGIKKFESWINSKVDKILLNCEALKKELGTGKDKAVVVGDGVDIERFSPRTGDSGLRSGLGLKPGIPVIVYLGLLNQYQGLDLLLESVRRLKERGARFQVLIMGYPLGDYPMRAKQMGLEEVVKFVGRVNYFEAEKWLSLGDIAVAPKVARSESNGKVLNYLAMGLPVVCFDREVNQELAGDCAEYVGYVNEDMDGNAERLAGGIERLLEDEKRRRELSAQGRIRAERFFSWDKIGERIMSAYQELLGR